MGNSLRMPEQLETNRLWLNQFKLADFSAYAAILADPEVMKFVGNGRAMSREMAWLNLAKLVGHWCLLDFGLYAVRRKQDGKLLGRVGLYQPEGWPGLELGWCIERPSWGQGYAFEAALEVKQQAKHRAPDDPLISLIHPNNLRSIQLAWRLRAESHNPVIFERQKILLFTY